MENAWSKRGNRENPRKAVSFHGPGQSGQSGQSGQRPRLTPSGDVCGNGEGGGFMFTSERDQQVLLKSMWTVMEEEKSKISSEFLY